MICERCHKETNVVTGSYFNEQLICMECREKESKHPDYTEAKRVELEEVKSGNYNYGGIGLPDDLK